MKILHNIYPRPIRYKVNDVINLEDVPVGGYFGVYKEDNRHWKRITETYYQSVDDYHSFVVSHCRTIKVYFGGM